MWTRPTQTLLRAKRTRRPATTPAILNALKTSTMATALFFSRRCPFSAHSALTSTHPFTNDCSAMSSSSVEMRLSALETQLGVQESALSSSTNNNTTATDNKDLSTRLHLLEQQFKMLTDSTFKQTWAESDKLLQELDPGTALTHQQPTAAPILYRNQQVLANAADLERDFKTTTQMLNLLLIGQAPVTDVMIKEEHVTQAPILVGAPCVSAEDAQRVQTLQHKLTDLQGRMGAVAQELDSVLDNYHTLISVCSEKMVLADEEVRLREQSK